MRRLLLGLSCLWVLVLLVAGCQQREEPAQQSDKSNEMAPTSYGRYVKAECPHCGFPNHVNIATNADGQQLSGPLKSKCQNCDFPLTIELMEGKVNVNGNVKD